MIHTPKLVSDQLRALWARTPGASLLLLLAGVGLVAMLELLLQVLEVGPPNNFFVKNESGGVTHYVANRSVAHRFFQPQYRRDLGSDISFIEPKPANTVRLFVLGASTTIGWPNPPNTSFPRYLDQMLADVYPSRHFEVINCGLTAINTFCLLDFAEEIVDYSPDLIIIYAGHNEFVGPYGVTTPFLSVGNNWHGIRLFMYLQRSRIYYLVKQLVFQLRSWSTDAPSREEFGLHLVDREIGPGDDGYEVSVRNFRRNLEEILMIAAERKIPVMLSTLTSNVRDFHPLRSRCDGSGLSEQIETLADEGQLSEAAAVADRARQGNPDCADIRFQLGRVRYLQKDYEGAATAYAAARDLDRMPFRAPSPFNEVIRELAAGRSGDVLFHDVEEVFAAFSPHGLVGNELITEYLHPTVYGHYLIARSTLDVLASSAAAGQWGPYRAARLDSYSAYTLRLGYGLRDVVFARNYLIRFLTTLPYKEPPRALRRHVASLMREQAMQMSRLDAIARRTFEERGELEFLRGMKAFLLPADRKSLEAELR